MVQKKQAKLVAKRVLWVKMQLILVNPEIFL